MNFRKILSATLVAVNIATAASAAGITPTISGNTVSISLETQPNETRVMFLVKAGADISDNSSVYAIEEETADKDGKVTFTFSMADKKNNIITDGEYDIYIRSGAKAEKAGSICYAIPQSRQSKKEAFEDAAGGTDVSAIIDTAENLYVLKAMGFDMDAYNALAPEKKGLIPQMMYDYAQGHISEDGAVKAYADALSISVAAVKINDGGDAGTLMTELNLSFENKSYNSIDDEARKNFIKTYVSAGGYTSAEGLVKAYEEANMLYTINNTRYDGLENVLAGYAASLGINSSAEYASYLALGTGNAYKIKANETLAELLKNTPAQTVAVLRTYIQSATNTATATVIVPSTSTGGGGSSGGGGGINSIPSGTTAVLPTSEDAFDDLDEAVWAKTAINKLAAAGIISGDGNGMCRPNDVLTREEFVTMLVSALHMYDKSAECDFADVNKDAWYYRYVASAYGNGLIYGVSDTEFGIGAVLTRQDLAAISYRAATKAGTAKLTEKRDFSEFADYDKISEYAREAVEKLYCAEIINGMENNSFVPEGSATRAQGALIIYNLFF